MIIILFLSISIILLIYSICERRKYTFSDPVFLLLSSNLMSIFFVVLNYDNWNVKENFSSKTVAIVVLSVLVFVFGSSLSSKLYKILPKKKLIIKEDLYKDPINIPKKWVIFFVFFISLSSVFYFITLLRKSSIPFWGFKDFMTTVRPLLKDNKISISFLSVQLLSISKMLAYIFTYSFFVNYIFFKQRNLGYLLIPFAYILMSLLTSGRIYIIYFVIYAFSLYFILNKNKYSNILKIVLKTFVFIFICLFLFGALANVVGRNTSHSIMEQLSIYIGGPLVSLDLYLKNLFITPTKYFGEETLIGVYQILNKLQITNIQLNRHLEYVQFGNNWGNVYTAIRRYIHDYGFFGSQILMFVMGAIYRFFYEIIISSKRFGKLDIFYSMLIYPIPMLIIDDLFLSNLLSINTVYDIIYIQFGYYFIIKYLNGSKSDIDNDLLIKYE